MLKQLRQKKVMKRVLWALALLIIPAFVFWGAGGLREGRSYAGMMFGKRVSFEEYKDALTAVRNRALMTYGSSFYQLQDILDLEEEAWDYLIMLKEARRKKIRVSDAEVVSRIASFGFFKDKDGNFSQRTYELILNNTFRTSPRNFEEEIRQSIMIEKLVQQAIAMDIELSEAEIEEALKKEAEQEAKIKEEQSEKKDEEETAEERRKRIKTRLLTAKRFEAYQAWQKGLHERAGLISNIIKEEEIQKGPKKFEGEIPEE